MAGTVAGSGQYHIYTNDQNYGLSPAFDRFDVLLNNNVVFKDMNQNQLNSCLVQHDLGRREQSLTVTGAPGESINLVFRVQNMFDSGYNTYVCVDDVRLEIEP
jgi:D-hexose-6-phosphate mutarotase